MENYKGFYKVFELMIKINKAIDEEKNVSTPTTRRHKDECNEEVKKWLEANYYNNGIVKDFKYRKLMTE